MDYATVNDIKIIMDDLIDKGYGDFEVTCNSEYSLAKPNDKPEINVKSKTVDLGGYC